MPPDELDELGALLHRRLATAGASPSREAVVDAVRAMRPLASGDDVAAVATRVLDRLTGLGPLQPLLDDAAVSEVMVNGPGPVWVERDGTLCRTTLVLDGATIEHLIERVVAPLGLRIDRSSPLVDARLPDGSRVHAVVPPLAVDGACLTIRRFTPRVVSLDELCPPGVASLLRWAVQSRANVLVSGGTSAGKTTLLNALAAAIPPGERVVTIEDTAELCLPGDHVVRLEARPANADGLGAVTVRTLVRNALRMRPDRIIVGECRGPEALDVLQAMNTGHEGSLSTCHANTPGDALRRLELLVLMGDVALPLRAVREHVTSALDLVVQMARTDTAARRVAEVAEVATSGRGVHVLADASGLRTLPARRPRWPRAAAPSAKWVVR
jgi:pilus assembly protein CpaF